MSIEAMAWVLNHSPAQGHAIGSRRIDCVWFGVTIVSLERVMRRLFRNVRKYNTPQTATLQNGLTVRVTLENSLRRALLWRTLNQPPSPTEARTYCNGHVAKALGLL
jgi:hypothetical protein